MAVSNIRRRLTRRVIILLVIVNTALWASFTWSGKTAGRQRSRAHVAATGPSRSLATPRSPSE